MRHVTLLSILFIILGCTSLPEKYKGRVFLDSSIQKDNPLDWAETTKVSWEDDGKLFFKASHTIRGDERVNGCFDLAHLDAKEVLLSEIANDIKGSVDNAQQSLSEDAQIILGKVRSAEFSGRVTGLRFTEQYFERYVVAGVERIDCHALGEIKHDDYDRVKRLVVNRVTQADPRLKDAVLRKQIDFFAPKDTANAESQAENKTTLEPKEENN